jgi:hypothetical protein
MVKKNYFRVLPPVVNKQRKSTIKLSSVVLERVIVQPGQNQPDDQKVIDLSKKVDVLGAANKKLEDSLNTILEELRLVQRSVQLNIKEKC